MDIWGFCEKEPARFEFMDSKRVHTLSSLSTELSSLPRMESRMHFK